MRAFWRQSFWVRHQTVAIWLTLMLVLLTLAVLLG